jgi:iron complex outermembrane recepter protein
MKKMHITSLLSVGLLALVDASICHAQSADASAPASPASEDAKKFAIEEVVVTARRKEENLQEVPLSITALSSDELERQSINTAQDLMGKVGSMVIGPNATMRNAESPNIRGQGASLGSSPGVVMYWAEVPLPTDSFANNQGGPGMFFDVQNMQVLKGPQGTLFGRNTTGGAFLLEPTKPQDTFSVRVQGETGNYNDSGMEAVVNAPLYSGDVVQWLSRIGIQKVHRDGFTKDIVTGKDYDDKNYWTGRFGLTLRVGENFENTLLAYRTQRDENGTGNVLDGMNSEQVAGFLASYLGTPLDPNLPANAQFGCQFFNGQAPSTNCGQDMVAEQQARDIRHVQLSARPKDVLTTGSYVDIFSWDLADNLKLRNILSKSYYQREFNWDQDGSRAALNDLADADGYSSDTDAITEEWQLQGALAEQGLSYVVGAYYEKREPNSLQQNRSVALFVPTVHNYDVSTRSRAIYAQGTYDLSAIDSSLGGWILTAGVRRTKDDMFGESHLTTPAFSNDKDEYISQFATTWLASASYQFDSAMAYGKISKGYKSGGFTALAANPTHSFYEPEYVTNYELGVKSDTELAEIPLRLNAAVFYSDYKDMQRTSAESYQSAFGVATFNSGKSVIKGFEMDFILLATERLQFSGNYSYSKGEFKEFLIPRSSMTPQTDCNRDDVQNDELGDYSCIPFTDLPKQQYSLSVNYELPLDTSVGIVETTLTYSWVDERYVAPITTPEAEPGAWLDSFGLVNASISWREVFESRFDLQLFGTNLTDEEYRISNSNVWNELGYKNSIWGEPRMYGLRATYRWGDE